MDNVSTTEASLLELMFLATMIAGALILTALAMIVFFPVVVVLDAFKVWRV